MTTYQETLRTPSRLASALHGKIVIPEHARFDEARQAWNLAIDQRPAAVAFPESAQDVAATVLFARGVRPESRGPGHGSQRGAARLAREHDPAQDRPDAPSADRPRAAPRPRRGRRALARARRGRGAARARRAAGLLA